MPKSFIPKINSIILKSYTTVFSVLICMFIFSCNPNYTEDATEKTKEIEPLEIAVVHDSFLNISLNGLQKSDSIIQRNQVLSEILQPFGISGDYLAVFANSNRHVFNVKSIRAGQEYSVIYANDSLKRARYFVYRSNMLDYYIFHFSDSGYIEKFSLPVDTVQREIAATIEGSLIQTLNNLDVPSQLGFKLSEILAWQIDFFKIRKGDWVKVIYDELHVNGKLADLGQIKAVEFNWMGTSYYGLYYYQDEYNTYFDQDGKSLRKAFLKAPLDYSRISSRYTLKRFHPVQKIWKAHLGTDYAAPSGTPIRTVGDGIVIESGYGRGNGNYVKVKHNETYTTQYLHMSRIAPAARKGKHVMQGQVIGYVGSTGLATGPHLCFRFWKNGKQIDPFTVKTPPTIPIKPEHQAAFNLIKKQYLTALDEIKLPPAA